MAPYKFNYQLALKLSNMLFMVLFTYAATSKLISFDYFQFQLSKMPLISGLSAYLVWLVPCAEYAIVLLFLAPKQLLSAYYLSLGLLTGFTSYLIWVLNSGKAVPCSCGGVLSNLSWKTHILFNFAFIAIAIVNISILHNQKGFLRQT